MEVGSGMQAIGKRFGRVVHVAHLVEDIDAAMEEWMRLVGLGPWTCFRNIALDASFDGREFTLRIHEALAYIGDLQIQLVQSLNPLDEATPYSDFLHRGHFGVHHMAFFSQDVDSDVARAREQGFDRVCSMRDKAGYRYFYCQSASMPEVWIEFLEWSDGLQAMYTDGIEAARDWDGTNPVQNIDFSTM